jgi:hypothetical protein
MKYPFLATLLASSSLLMVSCDGRPAALSQSAVAPPTGAQPLPPDPVVDENAALEKQIAELKAQEAELRLQLQRDQLAQEKADFERQRDDLAREKAALEAAAAAPASTAPPAASIPSVRRAQPVSSADAPPAAASRDYQMFYEGLASYGQWMETAEYGYVWQPASPAPGWRPYTVGRWADSDQGWTWISDEPYGWATYHYGRWALLERQGWIWVPGDTWAPAWVSWRNNADLVGWSPLPPETVYADDIDYGPGVDDDYGISPDAYTFMPVQYFDGPVYEHYYPIAENRSCFSLTIGITRIAIRSGNVHCDGPERLWVNGRLSRPMTRYRLDRDYGYDDRHDYRPRFDNDRLSCYSPRVRTSWNEGLRPSRLHGRMDDIKVVRRQEVFRGDLSRRYREEQRERRGRATAVLQQEPVRRLADRHGALEKVRSQRDQLTQRRGGSERSSSLQPALERSGRSDRVRGEGARQEVLQKERLEASRKELKERQDEVTKLRQQRESAETRAKTEPQRGNREGDAKRGDPANQEREANARREQANQNETRQRQAEQQQRGQRDNVDIKEREASARRGQTQSAEARQREELKQREEAVTTLRQQRDSGENKAKTDPQRGNREGDSSRNEQAGKEREEAARREQGKQNETRQREAGQQQRGQREAQANQAREESARREQSQQNETRQREAGQQQRGQREAQGNQAREEAARREQAKQNEARQRQAEQQQRGQREALANQVREESARREQAKQNEARQRQAEQQQRSQRESQAREEAGRRQQSQQNEARQRQAGQESGNRERENNARRDQAKQAEDNNRRQSAQKAKQDEEDKSEKKRGR